MKIEQAASDLAAALNSFNECGEPAIVTAWQEGAQVHVKIDFGPEGYQFCACAPENIRQHFADELRQLADVVCPIGK